LNRWLSKARLKAAFIWAWAKSFRRYAL
jgi:hypothetical protein